MIKTIDKQLRKLHGQLHEMNIAIKRDLLQRKEIKAYTPDMFFLVGTPIHPNVGDCTIAAAEIAFLNRIIPKGSCLAETTEDAYCKFRRLADRRIAQSEKPILWHGGGNMGDVWLEEEKMRRKALTAFVGKRIIMFPQTIYYTDTKRGRRQKEASVKYYNGREGLTLMAREEGSFEIMKSLYPDTEVVLMPDIVLSSCAEDYGVVMQERNGVLMCLRNDIEKSIQDDLWEELKEYIGELGESIRVTDMGADRLVFKEYRDIIIREKMQEFCGAKLAITDRLHGMVFAALTGTPCVAFGNNNHKVKSTYKWIDYLPYIKYAESMEEAMSYIPDLLAKGNCKFDNAPLTPYFEKLKDIIIEACNNH